MLKMHGDEKRILAVTDHRLMELDPSNGMAHKRLADALAILGRTDDALEEFTRASNLLPDDICCATHVHYDSQQRQRLLSPLSKP